MSDHYEPPPRRAKHNYVGAPKIFLLEQACNFVWRAFATSSDHFGIYIVGSALERYDYRDVDVRLIMEDAAFEALFPSAGNNFQHHPMWLLLTTSISAWLARQADLPVDFQIQPQTYANRVHQGSRDPIGIVFSSASPDSTL